MKSLVGFSCLLAIATAKPDIAAPAVYGSRLVSPAEFSYSTYPAGVPIARSTSSNVISPVTSIYKTQYHAQNEFGQASYGHSEALQAHNAVQDAAGNKMGSYSYIAPDGQVISTNYIADSLGYRAVSNADPAGPNLLPAAPSETPEVLAARATHLKAHEIVRSRHRRSVAVTAPVAYAGAGVDLGYVTPIVHTAGLPITYSTHLAPISTHAVPYLI